MYVSHLFPALLSQLSLVSCYSQCHSRYCCCYYHLFLLYAALCVLTILSNGFKAVCKLSFSIKRTTSSFAGRRYIVHACRDLCHMHLKLLERLHTAIISVLTADHGCYSICYALCVLTVLSNGFKAVCYQPQNHGVLIILKAMLLLYHLL